MEISATFDPADLVEQSPAGSGVHIPRRFALTATGMELPYRVQMQVALEAGRFVCRLLTAIPLEGGPPITTEGLRELPIGELIRNGAESVLLRVEEQERVQAVSHAGTSESVQVSVVRPEVPLQLTEEGPTEDNLRAVAAVYRLAYAAGLPPTQTVTRRLGLARSTAGRWVRLARDKGMLGAAAPRKAGEQVEVRTLGGHRRVGPQAGEEG